MATWIKRIFPEFEFGWLAREMSDNLPRELDFRLEHANADRLRRHMQNDSLLSCVHAPEMLWSTERVLCMEFIDEAVNMENVDELKRLKVDTKWLALTLCQLTNRMVYEYGFVHADLHAGNMLVRQVRG